MTTPHNILVIVVLGCFFILLPLLVLLEKLIEFGLVKGYFISFALLLVIHYYPHLWVVYVLDALGFFLNVWVFYKPRNLLHFPIFILKTHILLQPFFHLGSHVKQLYQLLIGELLQFVEVCGEFSDGLFFGILGEHF